MPIQCVPAGPQTKNVPNQEPCKTQRITDIPFVSHGGGQLWHGTHSKEHDAQEGDSKDGSGPCSSLVNPTKQGPNDERHDNNLNQPAQMYTA